jgi:hypothetical protein
MMAPAARALLAVRLDVVDVHHHVLRVEAADVLRAPALRVLLGFDVADHEEAVRATAEPSPSETTPELGRRNSDHGPFF